MKAKKLLLFALVALLGLLMTACSNEDDITTGTSEDIVRFNGSISETTGLRATIDKYTGGGNFDTGDIWGLYATVGANHILKNFIYEVNKTTLLWSGISETDKVAFAAHYPRITTAIDNPEAYVFNAAASPHPDLLVAPAVSKSKGEIVNLTFKHVMHQICLNIAKDVSLPGEMGDARITLLNMKSSAKVNLLTGEVDLSAASGTNIYPTKGTGDLFFVAPQTLTEGDERIQIDLGGKTYIYKVPTGLTKLESGKRLSLYLTLKAGGTVTLTQAISEWVGQGSNIYDSVEWN